jgi:predicted Zn finger-like uncharacterized protein
MQIACPACKTRISVPDDKIKPQGTKVKCGKCSKVFTVKKKTAEKAPDSTPVPSAAPAAQPEGQSELDKLFGEPPPAAVSAPTGADPAEDLGLGYSSAPVTDDESYLGGDNFGAEMGNYKTQLRPMGGGRDDSLFGDSSDLEAPAPSPRERVDDLFGSSDDLVDEPPPARPARTKAATAKASADNLFEEEAPRGKTNSVMPSKENLDDLFGKGLDDDSADDMVNKLLDSKPQKKARVEDDVADLFGPRDEKPERKTPAAAAKLDSLFEDEPDPVPAPKRESTPPARREAPPAPAGPSAEELAATMKLEPALKEEDLPKPPPVKAPEIKIQQSPKAKFPVKAVVWSLILLCLAGGVAAAIFVPAVNAVARQLVAKLPLEKVMALIEPKPEVVVAEPIHISATVQGGRLLTGGRGDSLYVVEGSVTNNYPGSRSFIKVQGKLIGADGAELAVREVFAGNILNDEEIRGLERVKIDGMLNRSVGGGLQNFNVPAGKTIPYQIVFYDVDQPVQSQTVVAIGSEPGN